MQAETVTFLARPNKPTTVVFSGTGEDLPTVTGELTPQAEQWLSDLLVKVVCGGLVNRHIEQPDVAAG